MKTQQIKLVYSDYLEEIGKVHKLVYLDDGLILNFYGLLRTISGNIERIIDQANNHGHEVSYFIRMITNTLIFERISFKKIKEHVYMFSANQIIDTSEVRK